MTNSGNYTLLVFLEGVIVNITPSWIRAPLGKHPTVFLIPVSASSQNLCHFVSTLSFCVTQYRVPMVLG
jgi:hypothetical protein